MDFNQVVKERRSIRRYLDKPVATETIQRLLGAARLAPSWKNLQCWRFIVVQDVSLKEQVASSFPEDNPGKKAINAAPVVIILCANPQDSGVMGEKEYYMLDAGLAMDHLILAAQNEGLGTCWMGLFDDNVIRKALEIPQEVAIIALTPLGYYEQNPRPRPRKELKEIAFSEKWGNPIDVKVED